MPSCATLTQHTCDNNELSLGGHDPGLAVHLPDDDQLALVLDLLDHLRAIGQTLGHAIGQRKEMMVFRFEKAGVRLLPQSR